MAILSFIITPPKRFEPLTKETCVRIDWFGMYESMDDAKHCISTEIARSIPVLNGGDEEAIETAAGVILSELECGKALDGIYVVRHPESEQFWMLADPFIVPKDGPFPLMRLTLGI